MILYIENHRDATRKILGSINIFGTVSRHKISTKKSLCSYTNSKRSERKSHLSKRKKEKKSYLEISIHKESKDLYSLNYKILMKEIKIGTNKWRDMTCSWIGKISIIKMTTLINITYRSNAIFIKSPMVFFTELEQNFLQFIPKHRRP